MKNSLVHLAAALRFITILPAGSADTYHPRAMIPFFPAVGIILGLIIASADALACRLFAPPAAAAIVVILLAFLTGALHLDGLADTADGLFSHRGRAKALSIMKDSRIGVMGATALACIFIAKYAGIAGMPSFQDQAGARFLMMVLVPAYARASMIAGIFFLPYARPEGGTGSDLFGEKLGPGDFWGVFVCMLISLSLGLKGVVMLAVFCASCSVLILFYRRQIGAVTGDMLGAMCEATEALLFIAAAAAI